MCLLTPDCTGSRVTLCRNKRLSKEQERLLSLRGPGSKLCEWHTHTPTPATGRPGSRLGAGVSPLMTALQKCHRGLSGLPFQMLRGPSSNASLYVSRQEPQNVSNPPCTFTENLACHSPLRRQQGSGQRAHGFQVPRQAPAVPRAPAVSYLWSLSPSWMAAARARLCHNMSAFLR